MSKNNRKVEAREFLPAALSLEKSPASPAGRWLLWVIVLFFVSTIAWATMGEVDIVAVAPGKIIPDGKSKPIQSLVQAKVTTIAVKEGQVVQDGDLLLQLDDANARAEYTRLEQRYQQVSEDERRFSSLLDMVQQGGGDENAQFVFDELQKSSWTVYQDKIKSLDKKKVAQRLEKKRIQFEVEKFEAVLPIIRHKENNLKKLADKNLSSKQQYLDQKQIRLETEHELKSLHVRIEEIVASLARFEHQLNVLKHETEKQFREQKKQSHELMLSLKQDLQKQQQQIQQYRIESPIAGKVHQLSVLGKGSVVTAAQQLMIIVPEDRSLEIEAYIRNSDIGFVREEQSVEVKIDAFPFTRYGVLQGQLDRVASDATESDSLGLVYKSSISLQQNHIDIQGNRVALTPGMSVTVEVITGKRRLIDYFLSPLQRYGSESARER